MQRYHKNIVGIDISQKDVELLGSWLNVQYKGSDDGQINHSGNLYLFNAKQLITILPFGVDSDSILEELQKMNNDK